MIYKEQLERRLDPYYYQPKFISTINGLHRIHYPLQQLGSLISTVVNSVDIRKYTQHGVPYIRVGYGRDEGVDLTNVKYVKASGKLQVKGSIKSGDVLITHK